MLRRIICITAACLFLVACGGVHNQADFKDPVGEALQANGDDTLSVVARLASESRGEHAKPINLSWVNGEDSTRGRPGTAFYLSNSEAKQIIADLSINAANTIEIGVAGGEAQKRANEDIQFNFKGETLEYFVEQTLGGILQVNYVIDEPLQGTVTFKTEKPIERDQLLSLVRVMLGRNGYILKLIDNIFHVGRPETIAKIESNAGFGAAGDLKLRVLPIRSATPEQAAEVLRAILPAGASAMPIAGTDKIALRARPEDISAAEELVGNLYNRGSDSKIVSILRLQQSSAVQVTAKVSEFFQKLYPNKTKLPFTIVPLEEQESLLVAVESKSMLDRIRRIVNEVDYSLTDSTKLRVISLQYLPAQDVAQQLSEITGGSIGSGNANVKETAVNGAGDKGKGDVKKGDADKLSDQPFKSANVNAATTPITFVADTRNNALLVKSTYKDFKHVQEVVRALDRPLSQVVIEATIAEVTINETLAYGVQWYLSKGSFALGSGTVATDAVKKGTGAFSLNTGGVDVVLQALEKVTNLKVISSPYLTVIDGKKARLVIGDQVPFATGFQSNTSNGATTVTNSVDIKDTGIVLQVEPNIRSNNSVLMKIEQQVSNVAAQIGSAKSNLTPTISTRTINSEIVVESGRTILLGGLIQEKQEESESGVPVLRKIPLFGELFNDSTETKGTRTELLVMITPRVVRKQSELQSITDTLRRELSSF
ncbi:type II secretion system secretin GspD [Polycladidibacter hongkongensis]|uniref:type II secretion system secretin GspD n=1 Tax=Polycladidibacter hongkongensis TaxID=1647556 RepID=UPI00083124C7|nr:type II secretion system secretin GspD [Pseudovibrio hongkongensis]